MKDKTTALRTEISAIQNEIVKLKEQEANLKNNLSLPVYSGNPERFSVDTKVAAEKLSIQQPQLAWIRDAIAALERQLPAKMATLNEFKAEQEHQQKLARVEQGRVEIRSKIEQVSAIAESLTSLYMELKALKEKYHTDFRECNPSACSVGASVLGRDSLLNFHGLMIPKMFEEANLFIATSLPFDPYAHERQQKDLAERQAYAARIVEAERAKNEGERQRKFELNRQEVERLTGTLGVKEKELEAAEKTRAEWATSGSNDSSVRRADNFISGLNVEISELKAKISKLNASIAD